MRVQQNESLALEEPSRTVLKLFETSEPSLLENATVVVESCCEFGF